MGEYFMNKGRHVLIIYDDLSKHAVAYRALSLLIRRPRDARHTLATFLSAQPSAGTRRQAERRQGRRLADRTAHHRDTGRRRFGLYPDERYFHYRRSDFLETELFHAGIRPAVNPGISVSRVGGNAQIKAMKRLPVH